MAVLDKPFETRALLELIEDAVGRARRVSL
jgi:hypothetical protein